MNPFFPTTGSEAEWNAAYCRLEDYLSALHLVNKVYQCQIILRLLNAAADKHARDPDRCPTALALEELDAALEQWFARILPEEERPGVMGYVALLITDGAKDWPMHFLADDIPIEFQQRMQDNDMRAGPDLQISSMVPRPIDLPLVEALLKEPEMQTQNGAALIALVTVVAAIALSALLLSH